jgi:hypothetical protein
MSGFWYVASLISAKVKKEAASSLFCNLKMDTHISHRQAFMRTKRTFESIKGDEFVEYLIDS